MSKWLRRQMSRGLFPDLVPAGYGLRSDAGHPSPSAPPPAGDPGAPAGQTEGAPGPNAGPPTDDTDTDDGNGVDWKAKAREWERRAKDNKGAAEELEQLKAAQMSEQEKAVTAAKAEGHAEAMKSAGLLLAAAELKSAAKDKGLNIDELSELLKVETFVDDKGAVDSKAIGKAVDALAKIAPAPPAPPGRSGAPLPGGSGGRTTANPSLSNAVAARYGK
jgi:hypothetical protein